MHSKQVDIDLGVIEAHDGLVRDYIEKPSLRYQVSMGIYVYEARALHHLPEGPCQFPDLVHRLLAEGEIVAACETDADWYDIGTVERVRARRRRRRARTGEVPPGAPRDAVARHLRGDAAPEAADDDQRPRRRAGALSRTMHPKTAIVLKRVTDAVVAALALLVLAPVLAAIALLIVLDSPGPVLYRSERAGHRGRPLRMLKFRKMRTGRVGRQPDRRRRRAVHAPRRVPRAHASSTSSRSSGTSCAGR